MKRRIVLLAIVFFATLACNTNRGKQEKIDSKKYSIYLEKGDKISNQAQGVLLGNVSQAMKEGGPEYAVEFCSLKASSIIDSLSQANNCTISRVSEKNRNPENAIKNETEKQLWELMAEKAKSAGTMHDTLIHSGKSIVYYKPIKTALPACLNCHGKPGEDIQPAVAEKIKLHYPDDKATGYALNDFRGMWKIQFNE